MRRTLSLMVCLIALSSAAAFAQQAPRASTPAPPAATAGQTPAPPAPSKAWTAADPRVDSSDVNIALTVTITDKAASGTQTKTVTLMLANQEGGRVRSSGSTIVTGSTARESQLNVDANTLLMKSGLIRAWLTMSYTPEWTDEQTRFTGVTHSSTLFLKDGTPTVITQAADPTKGTRAVSVEVTAKVIR